MAEFILCSDFTLGWENSVLFSRRRLRKFCAFLSVEAEKIPCFFLGGGCGNSVLFSRWRLRKFRVFFFSVEAEKILFFFFFFLGGD